MVAIGPQNALIIKQGLRRSSVLPVLAVVMISDFFLALLGITGVGLLVERAPWLL
ncbi:arginine exporter protein ArgO [Corynebacterium suicordis]|nr:arginine exporter protein ArgO [Corynebacterium suicordis]